MNYDLLKESWIPVITFDGEYKKVGIYEAISRAHELKEITEVSPMKEYGIYRMLCAFIMDAYRVQNEFEYMDLLDSEHFDSDALDCYIQQCIAEGSSFDLFDEKRPFMQSPYDKEFDKENNIKPVATIDYSLPSGHNHVHFDHTLENDSIMTADEAARSLMAVNIFCCAMGAKKYPSTINGAPPLYCIIKGENLFETLAYSIIIESNCVLKYDNPKVFWRENIKVKPTKEIDITSVLYGMTFPCRRVRLIPESDGDTIYVRNVFLQQGMKYVNYQLWNDPHVAYKYDDEGRIPIRASLDKEPWRDISNLIKQEEGAPLIIKQYLNAFDDKQLNLITYGVVTNQQSYLSLQKSEMGLAVKLAKNSIKRDFIDNAIKFAEQVAKEIRYHLKNIPDNKESSNQQISQAVFKFYSITKTLFFKNLCPSLSEADVNDRDMMLDIMNKWMKEIRKQAIKVFEDAADTFGVSAKILLSIEREKMFFISSINKIGKEGK